MAHKILVNQVITIKELFLIPRNIFLEIALANEIENPLLEVQRTNLMAKLFFLNILFNILYFMFQAFILKFVEIGKVLFSTAVLHGSSQQQVFIVIFLFSCDRTFFIIL